MIFNLLRLRGFYWPYRECMINIKTGDFYKWKFKIFSRFEDSSANRYYYSLKLKKLLDFGLWEWQSGMVAYRRPLHIWSVTWEALPTLSYHAEWIANTLIEDQSLPYPNLSVYLCVLNDCYRGGMAEKKHIVIRPIIKSRLTGTGDFLLLADCCEWKSMFKVDKDSLVVIRECCVELHIGKHRKGDHFVAGETQRFYWKCCT